MTTKEFNKPQNLKGQRVFPLEEYSVAEWCEQENGEGKPSQVHIVLPMPVPLREVLEAFSIRLKSRRAIQELIDVLSKHRDSVWPE